MISVKLYGGLGNQMFQYAFARSLAAKRNCLFSMDVSDYSRLGKPVKVDLLQMNVPAEVFQNAGSFVRDLFILRLVKKLGVRRVGSLFIEIMPGFDEKAITNSCTYLFGYFQSFKYFHEFRDELVDEFRFSDVENSGYYAAIKESESVGIHVRRGDYITDSKVSKLMHELDFDYYITAVNRILSIIEKPVRFFIFSNDLLWVEQNFLPRLAPFGECTVVDHNAEPKVLYDFECLKNCKHQIIANSTFSWWAADLNNYTGKRVVAPAKWFRKWKIQLNDFYPSDFIVL